MSLSARENMVKARFTAALLAMLTLFLTACVQPPRELSASERIFQNKADLLWAQIQPDWDQSNLFPAKKVGNAVFFSISDGTSRAVVCHGTGRNLQSAWNAAIKESESYLRENPKNCIWVKADLVSSSEIVTTSQLSEKLLQSNPQQFFQGLSFDESFRNALIESELNGAIIYDYYNGAANMPNLNNYLESAGREPLETYPENFIAFDCQSWLCDEKNEVYELIAGEGNYGRRKVENLDDDYVRGIITEAASYLSRQVRENGAFTYNYYPRFDETPNDYNIIRHAGAIWSMVQAYQISQDETIGKSIKKAIEYMTSQIIYDKEGRAFLYDETDDEVALGGGALAALALTEFTEVFQDNTYLDLCTALGEGICSLQDQSSGEYFHILSKDLVPLEKYRTVYYDGEATFALCRLYGLTGNARFLESAQAAADHFIAAGYTQYHDHWVSYSMNELTKYVTDKPEYWTFAMENIMDNMDYIMEQDRAAPVILEMLMAAFETYCRSPTPSVLSQEDLKIFIDAIRARLQWTLNGYFFPEYAIYMENPRQILGTFMTRNDGFRVRIDDVQHNIGGCFLFQKNYKLLTEKGF